MAKVNNLFVVSPKINSECINCLKRHVGCHATCESYLAYRQTLNKLNAKERERKNIVSNGYFERKRY